MKDNNIKRQHLYGTLSFAPDFSYMSLYCPPPNPGMQLILYRMSKWYSWGPEKENDLLRVIQAGEVAAAGELELRPLESLCSHCHPPSPFWSLFTCQGRPVTASILLSRQVMCVVASLQWAPGLTDSYPAREAKKTKVGRRLCPAHGRQAGRVCGQYHDFLLYEHLLPDSLAKSFTGDFDSAVVFFFFFFLGYKYCFCIVLIYSLISFLSTPFLVSQRAVFIPWKESQRGSWSNYYHQLSGDLQLANLSQLVNRQFPRQNSGNYLPLLHRSR